MATELEGSVEIGLPVDAVYEFVADPRNDPRWCERVSWCRQVAGTEPATGARYEALHKPSGYPRAHVRIIETIAAEPPRSIRWIQRDRIARFDIAYELEPTANGTLLTQRDVVHWRVPLMGPVGRRIVRRHIGEQHDALRNVLEAGRVVSD